MGLLFQPSPVPFRPHRASWRQPFYLHYEPLLRALEPVLGSLSGRVLDVGCGLQPYRELLGEHVTEYVGLDLPGELSRPTAMGTAESIPFSDGSFEAVLSTQVLEHLSDPRRAIEEARRVLVPGGKLVATVPGVWPTHEAPRDFWRFARYGVQGLLTEGGFAVDSLETLGGLWSTVGQMANLELQRVRGLRQLVPLVNLAAAWLDRRGAHEDLALAWLAVATRVR